MVDTISNNYAANVNNVQRMNNVDDGSSEQQQYTAINNQFERAPQYDTFGQGETSGGSPLRTLLFGAVGIAGLLTAIDFIFCKGRHVKKIFGYKGKTKTSNADPKAAQNLKTPDPENNINAGLPSATATTPMPKTLGQKIAKFFTVSIPEFGRKIWEFITKPFVSK